MFTAIVNGNGKFYRDRTERLYLHINKNEGHNLPYQNGRQVPITLVVGGSEYAGTLGARADYPYIYVATQLRDAQGVSHQLTRVLLANGLCKGDRVQLTVAGQRVSVA